MKKFSILPILGISVMMMAASVSAEAITEEAADAAVETAVEDEAKAAAAQLQGVNEKDIWGIWYGAGYIGDSNYAIRGEWFIMPGNFAVQDDISTPFETIEDADLYAVSPDGTMTVTGVVGTLTQQDIVNYDITTTYDALYDSSVGAKKLELTASYPDPKNPLGGNVETTSILLYEPNQSGFLRSYLLGKVWAIGERTLSIDSEGNMVLDNGAASGRVVVSYTTDYPVYVDLIWDGGGSIRYEPTSITEESVTLVNVDNPEETQVLAFTGEDAPTAPVTEEAAVAEAAVAEPATEAE